MVFNFENNKKNILGKKDKSNKTDWDKPIVRLCDIVNKKKDYFTTSSCSGRVILLTENDKKMPGLFQYRTHDKITFKELKDKLSEVSGKTQEMISFKQEPCILTVSCRDMDSQRKLFDIARNNGWKKSGIITTNRKFMVELMSTENLSLPIIDKGNILVDDDYLRTLVKKANDNLERTWEKIKRLEKLLKK